MNVETITVPVMNNCYLSSKFPDRHYAGNLPIHGSLECGHEDEDIKRILMRFKIPEIGGKIVGQRLYVYYNFPSGGTHKILSASLMDSPQDDLWVEGTVQNAVDEYGATWEVYMRNKEWDEEGGDFVKHPVGKKKISPADEGDYVEIKILPENFRFASDEKQTFVLQVAGEKETDGSLFIEHRGNEPAYVEIDVEVEGLEPVENMSAEGITEKDIRITWNEAKITPESFDKYVIAGSDDGLVFTPIKTITRQRTTMFIEEDLVLATDVDPYDESSDTYPNGRKRYYQVILHTKGFGELPSAIFDGNTIPAIRPLKMENLEFNVKDEPIEDDNKNLNNYNLKLDLDWVDEESNLEILDEVEIAVQHFFNVAWISPPDTEMVKISKLENIELTRRFAVGFTPYKVQGKIISKSGFERIFTIDKTTAQAEYTFPAPCPVALPDGHYPDDPPALRFRSPTGFDSGFIPIDLSIAAQQRGGRIFKDNMLGAPIDDDKYKFISIFNYIGNMRNYYTSDTTYPQFSRVWIIGSELDDPPPTVQQAWDYKNVKKLREQNGNPSTNRWLSKYTGGYTLHCAYKVPSLPKTDDSDTPPGSHYPELAFTLCGWTKDFGGYEIIFRRTDTLPQLVILRKGNFQTGTEVVAAFNYLDNPFENHGTLRKVEISISPIFSDTLEGDMITILEGDYSDVMSDDKIQLSNKFVVLSTGQVGVPNEQIHYTGNAGIRVSANKYQNTIRYRIYEFRIEGRIEDGLYSIKNLNTGDISPLSSNPIPQIFIRCPTDEPSELVYLEARIKNKYGAQNRTGEIDDYQGDVINNVKPIAVLNVQGIGFVNRSILFDGSLSVDFEGGALIYEFDFGDGNTEITDRPTTTHIYTAVDEYTARLRVQDEVGQWSDWVEADINIVEIIDDFELVELMSPWTRISYSSPSGTGVTQLPEVDYDIVQNMKGGNRLFRLNGFHHDPDGDKPLDERIESAEAEKDLIHFLMTEGQLISLNLEFFGIVNGVIVDHTPSMDFNDQGAFSFSLTFQEVDERQFGV